MAQPKSRILSVSTAGQHPAVALVVDGEVSRAWHAPALEGLAAALAPAVAEIMQGEDKPDLVAVCVGPGSFTGIRAGLALAQGLADGYGCRLIGVTQAEAFAHALPLLGERRLWSAIDSRRGRIFLDRGEGFAGTELAGLTRPAEAVAVAGDAAVLLAATLAARGANVMLTSAREAEPRHVAMVALQRAEGLLPPLAAEPLYIDAPAVTAPAQAAP